MPIERARRVHARLSPSQEFIGLSETLRCCPAKIEFRTSLLGETPRVRAANDWTPGGGELPTRVGCSAWGDAARGRRDVLEAPRIEGASTGAHAEQQHWQQTQDHQEDRGPTPRHD